MFVSLLVISELQQNTVDTHFTCVHISHFTLITHFTSSSALIPICWNAVAPSRTWDKSCSKEEAQVQWRHLTSYLDIVRIAKRFILSSMHVEKNPKENLGILILK